MKIKYLLSVLTILFSQELFAVEEAKKEMGSKEISYELLEKLYSSGKCWPRRFDNERAATLLFLEDVLYWVSGKNSLIGNVVGNVRVFSVGRSVNPELLALYEYADRKDVREIVSGDLKAIQGELTKSGSDLESILNKDDMRSFLCEMYKMLSGKEYLFNDDLEEYSEALNRKVMHKNMNLILEE